MIRREIVAGSNRSVAYSTCPARPLRVSKTSTDKSNFAVAPACAIDRTWRPGKSSVSSDPAWAKLLKWQKELVDWYNAAEEPEVRRALTAHYGLDFTTDEALEPWLLSFHDEFHFFYVFLQGGTYAQLLARQADRKTEKKAF